MIKRLNCPIGTATLSVYPCEGAPAVVICPGGGYGFTSPREAEPVARAWNAAGFAAFVLEYNCNEGEVLGNLPLKQLGWAVSIVRARAEEWKCTQQVAVNGFSAGGHLAASLGVFWMDDERFDGEVGANMRRPDALVLAYPVISAGEYGHRGSFENLVGKEFKEQQRWSLEKYVTSQTPETFIWHTLTDEAVPVENTLLFSQELRKQKISHELHLFPKGPHGLSLATPEVEEKEKGRMSDSHVAQWFELATQWIKGVMKD